MKNKRVERLSFLYSNKRTFVLCPGICAGIYLPGRQILILPIILYHNSFVLSIANKNFFTALKCYRFKVLKRATHQFVKFYSSCKRSCNFLSVYGSCVGAANAAGAAKNFFCPQNLIFLKIYDIIVKKTFFSRAF